MSIRHPKLFVLDTNVILHDASCLESFEENDVAIPITVLEELDKFKRGNEDIHFQAREFIRRLDNLTGPILSETGVSRGEGLGTVRVALGGPLASELRDVFVQDQPDHRILNTALLLAGERRYRQVVLVSKDTNIRLKARSLGLQAEDYEADKLKNFDQLYTGKRLVEGVPSEQIAEFFSGRGVVPVDSLPQITEPVANENFVIRNGSKSVLATYTAADRTLRRIEKHSAFGILPRNAEQWFALRALMDESIPLVTLAGKAGTGKTLLALAAALETRNRYQQIMLARPIVPLSNRDLGFLPGDIQAKLDPYMQPLFDNLNVIRHQFRENETQSQEIRKMLENEQLVITPLSYIRGRSLQRMYFIIDEAQNLTPHEVKTIITRAGEGTKIVLTGDLQQIDQPYLDALSNGLSHLINRMVGQQIYAHVTLEKGERSPLADLAARIL
jgi:PhoH-like ATPase